MSRLFSNLVKGCSLLGCLILLSFTASGQDCCPAPGTCNPCAGGISKLTLRYRGGATALIRITDNSFFIFNGLVAPGGTITVTGTANGNFAGSDIDIYVGSSLFPIKIVTNCSL